MTTLELTPELHQLERSVADLWQRARTQIPDETLTRALTLNLIAVTDRDHEQELHEAIARLLVRHPCRLFLVVIDDTNDNITARLTAEIQELRKCCQMVLEQLTLTSSTRDLAKIPGLVRPLLVNDIPIHLFWAMPLPADLGHLTELCDLADGLIVDSTLFGDGDWHRLELLEFLSPIDLAWLRLKPWRRALAEAFEHFEWSSDSPTEVEIAHGPGQGARATSQKLSRWLRDRLGTKLRFRKVDGACPSCEPSSLELGHGAVHVTIQHLCPQPRLEVIVTLGDRCLLPFHRMASKGNRGDLLAAAVDG